MLWAKPSSNVDQLLFINVCWFRCHLIFSLGLQVSFEVIEETDFFLQLIRVIFEIYFFQDVFFLDSLNVVKIVFIIGQHFSWVIEVYPNHIITQCISNSIFWRIVYPFFYSNVGILSFIYWFFRSFIVIVTFCAVLEDPLAFGSSDVLISITIDRFLNGISSISHQKFILTLLTHISTSSLNRWFSTN